MVILCLAAKSLAFYVAYRVIPLQPALNREHAYKNVALALIRFTKLTLHRPSGELIGKSGHRI
jgi:hypothetical protein